MLSFATKKQARIEEDDIDSWDDEENYSMIGNEQKKAREEVKNPPFIPKNDTSSSNWLMKYAVKSFQELKLHHTKVKFLKDWLQKNVTGMLTVSRWSIYLFLFCKNGIEKMIKSLCLSFMAILVLEKVLPSHYYAKNCL